MPDIDTEVVIQDEHIQYPSLLLSALSRVSSGIINDYDAGVMALIALFNVLPMVPLDGGFLFNDGVRAVIMWIKKGIQEETKEKIVKNVSLTISLLILVLILIPFFIKYI